MSTIRLSCPPRFAAATSAQIRILEPISKVSYCEQTSRVRQCTNPCLGLRSGNRTRVSSARRRRKMEIHNNTRSIGEGRTREPQSSVELRIQDGNRIGAFKQGATPRCQHLL